MLLLLFHVVIKEIFRDFYNTPIGNILYVFTVIASTMTVSIIAAKRNNKRLKVFAKQLYEKPLPPQTKLFGKNAECGHIFDDSIGYLDYAAGILIESEYPFDKLEHFYKNQYYKSASLKKSKYPYIEISKPDSVGIVCNNRFFNVECDEAENILFKNQYIVMLIDKNNKSIYDFRTWFHSKNFMNI